MGARAREGRCEIRVWMDNRAEVRMRGDAIFVRTVEGSRGRDEGSECSQPLPYNSVRDFQIRQTAGRSRVTLAQEPHRMNNFTAMTAVEDSQGGGDNSGFEVTWRAETDIASAPAAFFDDVRTCQDAIRQRFQSQNGPWILHRLSVPRRPPRGASGSRSQAGRKLGGKSKPQSVAVIAGAGLTCPV